METGIDKAKLLQYQQIALKHLHNPVRLRLTAMAGMVLLGIVVIYAPLSGRIQAMKRNLNKERERYEKIVDVEKLRKEAASYEDRIDPRSDANEWVQYVLDGLRQFEVKLRDMESGEPKKVGPYHAITLSMEIEGGYPALRSFVEWLEQSDRMLRIDSVYFDKRPDTLRMKIVILGLVPKYARILG